MKTLVIVTHPSLDQSRANHALIQELSKHEDINIHYLYEEYPNWTIDIEKEQQLLIKYDRIVLQFPVFWYSSPPLLKKWFDDVLTYGWAFGSNGDQLKGKEFIVAATAGGSEQDYRSTGKYGFTVNEFLRPLQVSIQYTDAIYLPAFVMYDTLDATDEQLNLEAIKYVEHILASAEVLVN